MELLYYIEAAFAAEVDVDQCDVGPQFREAPKRLGAVRCRPNDRDVLALQQTARGVDEIRVVIND